MQRLSNFFKNDQENGNSVGTIVLSETTPVLPGTWQACNGQIIDKVDCPEMPANINDATSILRQTSELLLPKGRSFLLH